MRTQAVPILITGSAEVDALPARYAVAVGHEDERRAIGEGTDVSAAAAYKNRLGAAVARLDIPDLFNAHPDTDKPSRESVHRWLATLTDVEVLDLMSRLTPGRTLAHALETVGVVRGMFADVRAFEAETDSHG